MNAYTIYDAPKSPRIDRLVAELFRRKLNRIAPSC